MTKIKSDTILELLEKVPLFDGFSVKEKSQLAAFDSQVLRFDRGEQIIREGDLEYTLYILLQGEVRITKNLPVKQNTDPNEAFIAALKPFSVFGEIALLGECLRTTNAYASGKTSVLRIGCQNLQKFEPSVQTKMHRVLLELLIQRLEDANMQIIKLTH